MPEKYRRYLRRIGAKLRPPRSIRFTRLGTYVTVLTVAIGLSAMNTGNNLLYMIFGLMLGFITASGVISEMTLRGLSVDWIYPGEIFAGETATLRLLLKNGKKKLPSFGVTVSAVFSSKNAKSSGAFERYFLLTPAGSHRAQDIEFRFAERGRYRSRQVKIETRFPFSFFSKYLTLEEPREILVYPALYPFKKGRHGAAGKEKERPAAERGLGESFWSIRDYSRDDNPKRISWKTSAKHAKLLVQETEKEQEKKTVLDLGPEANWSALSPEEAESAISFGATLLSLRFKEGFAVGLSGPGLKLPASRNRLTMRIALAYLAEFTPGKAFALLQTRQPSLPEAADLIELWRAEG